MPYQPTSECSRVIRSKRHDLELKELDTKILYLALKATEIQTKRKECTMQAIEMDVKHAMNLSEMSRTEEERDSVHHQQTANRAVETVLVHTKLASDTQIQHLMRSNTNVQSLFTYYLKQSMINLTQVVPPQ